LDPDRPGSSLYTAQIHGTGADLLRSLETLPARSDEFLDKAKRELGQLEQNIVKLSGAIQADWPVGRRIRRGKTTGSSWRRSSWHLVRVANERRGMVPPGAQKEHLAFRASNQI